MDLKSKNKLAELERENDQLKKRIREQYEELELVKFLAKDENNNHPQPGSCSPFTKKKSDQSLL